MSFRKVFNRKNGCDDWDRDDHDYGRRGRRRGRRNGHGGYGRGYGRSKGGHGRK
ncbi:NfeD family protein [Streptomyces sp. NBRC 110611]|nr:NfeD family protein [Streptomyces sp. NBRC 110611]